MNGNENENGDGPVVIGVGLPRTGTMSSALGTIQILRNQESWVGWVGQIITV